MTPARARVVRHQSISPMLATIGREMPQGEDWIFEPKYDGIRIIAFVAPSGVALVSRNGIDKTRQFPEVAEALRAIAERKGYPFVLDGEIVALEADAPARFQQLQARMHVTDLGAIAEHRREAPVALFAFDLLFEDSDTYIREPWTERRRALETLLRGRLRAKRGTVRVSDAREDGESMLRTARHQGWEGIIAKRIDAPYEAGRRSRKWLKLKIVQQQEFVIGGWTEPRRSRTHIGALLLGYYDADGKLVYAGHTGTGFTHATLRDLSARLTRIERKSSPFSTTPRTNERAHWARPTLVAEVKFSEWTSDGRLRQPVYLGLRDDKPARDVVREPVSLVGSARSSAATTSE